jgi:hypothetical protein
MARPLAQHASVQPNWRKVLAENVSALMEEHPELRSHAKLASRCSTATRRIGARTIGHLLNAEDGPQPQLDTIVAVAEAFKKEPWRLLMPNLGATNAHAVAQPSAAYVVPQRDAAAIGELYQRTVEIAAGLKALHVDLTGKAPTGRQSEVQITEGGALTHRRDRKRSGRKSSA